VRSLGRYRILERLASGGMADVYRAEVVGAEGVRKEVALKLVRGDRAGSAELVSMFVREARLAARLSHANIVQIFEFDQAEGRHFIAMELVRGHHLGRVLERCREQGIRFGAARAVFVAAEVATALAYAHQPTACGAPGLVHRDVSPHNVLVSLEGEVKLADFGIARAASRAGLTYPGTLEGKLGYVAPEQARGEAADARADLFALGVVLWELLAGRRLFERETEAASLDALLNGPPVSPPSAWNEAVPPELDALVLQCLERDPSRRIGCARELAAGLRALLLRLAQTPEDWELRPLMRRLWPGGAGGATPMEPTRPRASDPSPPESPVVAEPSMEESTRTLRAPGGSAPRWRAAVAGIGIAAALATIATIGWPGGRAPGAPTARQQAAAGEAPLAPPSSGAPPAAGPVLEPLAAQDAGGGPIPAASARLYRLGLPAEASGEGVLAVNATPWATLLVDGRRLGDTPREVRLPAGRHRVRVEHPRLGSVETSVEIRPGRRSGWYPRLDRGR
jgi:serine/threonine-protein kinase